ncbi:UNVERIFIED_CONTAM: hypothetical protein HDU68_012443 [Siphonaria sp. JEL0065]|nr:hypothetical protein HDU68_012443 [Siphonaria sp. JEL0065]
MSSSQPLLNSSESRSRSSLIRYYPDTYSGDEDESEDEYSRHEAVREPPGSNATDFFKEPAERGPKDSLFALLFVVAFVAFVVAAVNAVRVARHEEGEELRRTVYAAFKNCAGVLLGVSAASVLAGICWIMAMSAFVRPIVWGSVVAIPILCLGIFTFILTDALLGKANDPVYLDPQYNYMIALSFTTSTDGAVIYFIFIHFWTTAILSSIEKMTIAGVVGQWYFGRSVDETFDQDLVTKSLKAVVGPGFGSVCFASLVVASVEFVQFIVKNVRKNSRGRNGAFFNLIDSCMDCTGRAVSQISSYTLIYCGLTGAGVCEGAYNCTRLFRRNLVMGMATAGITRTLLFFGASAAAGGVGAGTIFYSARGTGSPYAWVVGGVGAFVPFYVVRFMSQIIQNT